MSKVDPSLIIDSIYEAAILSELWPDVLGKITQLSGTSWTVAVSPRDAEVPAISCKSAPEDAVSAHYARYADNQRSVRLLQRARHGFVTDHDLLTQSEIDTEPIYRDHLIPNGFGFMVGTALQLSDGDRVVLQSEGRYEDGPISRDVVDRLDALRPHLMRAALLSTRLSSERARSAVETLEAVGMAACAVVGSGKVRVANSLFSQEPCYMTTRTCERVALHDQRAQAQLEEALANISRGDVRSIALLNNEGSCAPAVLHVMPVRGGASDVFNQVAAILILTKATPNPIRSNALLQALFDLTPMEAALAARVGSGQTVEEIALEDDKTPGTVRTQLKGVFVKTGCHRQAELVRLLTQIVPAGM